MADTKVDNSHAVDALEQQVEALLSDVQAALHGVESRLNDQPHADGAGAAETPPPAMPEAILDASAIVQPLVQPANEPEAAVPAEPAGLTAQETLDSELAAELTRSLETSMSDATMSPKLETPAESPSALQAATLETVEAEKPVEAERTSPLDSAVSEMVADAAAALEHEQDAEAGSPSAEQTDNTRTPVAATLEDLDSQLASLTEQLLSEPSPEIAAAPPVHAHAPAPKPAIVLSTTHAPTAAAAGHPDSPAKKPTLANAAAIVKSAPARLNVMSPALLTMFGFISKPLNSQPRAVRDTLGWVALITLFWAATIWAYLLFFHKPVESEVPEHATHISTGEANGEGGHEKAAGKKAARAGEEEVGYKAPAIRQIRQAEPAKHAGTEEAPPPETHGEH